MYPAHRRKVLDEIRDRLDKKLPCRVVSTSLVEAGVDVDFLAVYRALAGLDSMIQAGGRCNREGKRAMSESIVSLFETDQTPPAFGAIEKLGENAAVLCDLTFIGRKPDFYSVQMKVERVSYDVMTPSAA